MFEGYVTGKEVMIDWIRSKASAYLYHLSPPLCGRWHIASIQHLRTSQEERAKIHERAHALRSACVPRLSCHGCGDPYRPLDHWGCGKNKGYPIAC